MLYIENTYGTVKSQLSEQRFSKVNINKCPVIIFCGGEGFGSHLVYLGLTQLCNKELLLVGPKMLWNIGEQTIVISVQNKLSVIYSMAPASEREFKRSKYFIHFYSLNILLYIFKIFSSLHFIFQFLCHKVEGMNYLHTYCLSAIFRIKKKIRSLHSEACAILNHKDFKYNMSLRVTIRIYCLLKDISLDCWRCTFFL